MNKKYDVIVVGAGPGGVFLAYELIQKKKLKNILLIEQGKKVEDRVCPIEKGGICPKCKPFCNITSGFSGAGAFSDGKLSLYNPDDDEIHIGGDLHRYIGVEETKKLIDYTDKVYLDFGADTQLEGTKFKKEVKEIYNKAKRENITLIDIPIRHLGTEKSHELYGRIEHYLLDNGIEMLFETKVADIIVEDKKVKGVKIKPAKYEQDEEFDDFEEIMADNVVLAVGRKGANWLVNLCNKHEIKTETGIVDIGIRYELPDEIMKDINKYMYEGKFIGRVGPFKDKVRTFCQNPSGFVSTEVYDNDIALVNGHSYKEKKSTNTNLAILVSHKSAVAGDITFALGYRTMTAILEFIRALDKVVEGFANPENLLYGPEIKFYSNQIVIDENFETSIKGLYSIGDGGGMTRGLMMASCSGVEMARILSKKI